MSLKFWISSFSREKQTTWQVQAIQKVRERGHLLPRSRVSLLHPNSEAVTCIHYLTLRLRLHCIPCIIWQTLQFSTLDLPQL